MELLVQENVKPVEPIVFNRDDLQAELAAYLDKYTGFVVTQENIPEAKAARAQVNKVRESIDAEKRRIKREFMEPYNRFETEVKGLLAMCDEVSGNIDEGVKEYETRTKAEKRARLQAVFNAETAAFAEFAAFEEVYEPRWLNVTFDAKDAEAAIIAFAKARAADVEAVGLIDADPLVKGTLLSQFRRTKSVADVLRLHEEIKARAEAERQGKAVEPENRPLPPPVAVPISEEYTSVTIRITAANAQITRVLNYMAVQDISYEEVY